MAKEEALEIVRRLQHDDAFAAPFWDMVKKEKSDEIIPFLKTHGIAADSKDCQLALDANWILSKLPLPDPIASADEIFDLKLKLQQGLARVVQQIDRGYERAMTMYTVAFYVGILMILASIYAALIGDSVKAAAVLGGLGMADILASIVFRPAQDVQNSRGNLAQLQAAFFSWFNDVHNWNEYLGIIGRDADARKVTVEFTRLREVSDAQMCNIERMMGLIEAYCETRPAPVPAPGKTAGKKRLSKSQTVSAHAPKEFIAADGEPHRP
jgi:hypothetical protein